MSILIEGLLCVQGQAIWQTVAIIENGCNFNLPKIDQHGNEYLTFTYTVVDHDKLDNKM